jgi:hypothetical protein
MFIYIHIRSYYMLFLYFNLFFRVMLDSLSCLFTSISVLITCCSFTLTCFLEWCCIVSHVYLHPTTQHHSMKQAKVKEQHVIRTDMDVNKHERLHNITLRNKLLDSLSCLFTSISVLITCCSFTLTCFLEWCCVVSHVYLHPYLFLLHADSM